MKPRKAFVAGKASGTVNSVPIKVRSNQYGLVGLLACCLAVLPLWWYLSSDNPPASAATELAQRGPRGEDPFIIQMRDNEAAKAAALEKINAGIPVPGIHAPKAAPATSVSKP